MLSNSEYDVNNVHQNDAYVSGTSVTERRYDAYRQNLTSGAD
jgi:hypothetical protein